MHPALQVLLGVSLVVVSLAVFLLVYGRRFDRLSAKGFGMSVEVAAAERADRIERKVDLTLAHAVTASTEAAAANAAVNNVPRGEPKLVDRVRSLERIQVHAAAMVAWQVDGMQRVAAHLGVDIPPPPTEEPCPTPTPPTT
jgi:hypothetical protein